MRSFRLFASEKERAAGPIGRGGRGNALPGKDWKKEMERGEKERPAGPEWETGKGTRPVGRFYPERRRPERPGTGWGPPTGEGGDAAAFARLGAPHWAFPIGCAGRWLMFGGRSQGVDGPGLGAAKDMRAPCAGQSMPKSMTQTFLHTPCGRAVCPCQTPGQARIPVGMPPAHAGCRNRRTPLAGVPGHLTSSV